MACAELKGQHFRLVFFTVATIPLFITVAIILSDQCENHQWILIVGAGMIAWAAAALVLQTPTWKINLSSMPQWVVRAVIASCIVMMGFIVREFVTRLPKRRE